MCLLRRYQLDSKSRRVYAAGNLCFISGLMLTLIFEGGFGQRHRIMFNGLRFLLMSLAIALFFWSSRRTSRSVSRL